MLRVAAGLLAIPHGIIAFWATTTDLRDPVTSGVYFAVTLADALALVVSIYGSTNHWLV